MEIDNHSDVERNEMSSQRYRSVMAPRQCEGLSNALRAAFDRSDSIVPGEFEQLLQRLN